MHAIELPADIDQNHQIHLQLPETVNARKAKVIVMYEDDTVQLSQTAKSLCSSGLAPISFAKAVNLAEKNNYSLLILLETKKIIFINFCCFR